MDKNNNVDVEYILDEKNKLEGIVITDSNEGWFLPTTKSDIEDWAKENGEEDTDFQYEKEWFDDYPNGGHYQSVKVLIEDAWSDQIRDYAFAHRKLWIQESQEAHAE